MKTASTPLLPVLATMLLSVFITPSARADRAENAFVKVRAAGAGVTRVDGRNFSAQGDTEVEIEAQPGWTLLTPSRVRVTKTQSPRYRVKSKSGEDDGQGDLWWTVVQVITNHLTDPVVAASVSAGGPYVYALPDDGADAAATFTASATKLGTHEIETRTTTYHNGTVVDESVEKSEPFTLDIDRWSWDWVFDDSGTTNRQAFTTPVQHLANGTHAASGTVEGRCSLCASCSGTASASTNVIVSLLKVSCNPWIGQDRTGDPAAEYESSKLVAAASLSPTNPAVKGVTWGGDHQCEESEKHDWNATFWTKNREKASATYLGETLTASAAGATAKTNFTIVKVDVSLSGCNEVGEENDGPCTVIPAIERAKIAATSISALPTAIFSCFPEDLPETELFSLACTGNALLCEIRGNGEEMVLAPEMNSSVSTSEFLGKKFAVVPKKASTTPNASKVAIRHDHSHALDKGFYTSVRFDFSVVSENGNGVQNELTDNRPADITITPSIAAIDLSKFRLSFQSSPKGTGAIINKAGTDIFFAEVGSPLNWKTSNVYWFGLLPDKECYTFKNEYAFTLLANGIPAKIRDYPVGWPDEEPVMVPLVQKHPTNIAHPLPSDDGSRLRIVVSLGDFSKTGIVHNANNPLGPLRTTQYAAETETEEHYHLEQWVGIAPSAKGGQADCFTTRGIGYFLGFGSDETTIEIYSDSTDAEAFFASVVEQVDQAEEKETEIGWQIWMDDKGLVEKSAKDEAGYNAAWRYHCTYANDPSLNLIDHRHPAFERDDQ